MLTHKQKAVLDYVAGYVQQTGGVSPSYDEIRVAMGMRSKNQIFFLVDGLIKRGRLRRLSGRARALEIVDKGDKPARKPVVTYPDAVYFKFDDEAKELVPWKP
jgi:repressor LexA